MLSWRRVIRRSLTRHARIGSRLFISGLLITMRDGIGSGFLGRERELSITNRHKGSIGRRLLGRGRGLLITNKGSIGSRLPNGLNGRSGLIGSSRRWLSIDHGKNVFMVIIAVGLSFTRTIAKKAAAIPTVVKPIVNLLGCLPRIPQPLDVRARKGGSDL